MGYEGSLLYLGTINNNSGICSTKADYYLAKDLSKKLNPEKDDAEPISKYKFVSLKEFKEMIREGHIRDSFSLCAFMLASDYIK